MSFYKNPPLLELGEGDKGSEVSSKFLIGASPTQQVANTKEEQATKP